MVVTDWQTEVSAAYQRVKPYVLRTPVVTLSGLDLPFSVEAKLEHLQHAGSFKARGAFNSLSSMQVPEAGLVAASGGNHGAAVAFACSRHRATLSPVPTTTILWCADDEDDFYDTDLIKLAPEIHLEAIADERRDGQNKGLAWLREGAHPTTFHQVIIAGGPPFVYSVTDILLENGFTEAQLQSDVYDYAPR